MNPIIGTYINIYKIYTNIKYVSIYNVNKFGLGVPELGIPPFDPFFANEVKQSKGAGLLGYKLTIHNVTESGWRLSEIKKIK